MGKLLRVAIEAAGAAGSIAMRHFGGAAAVLGAGAGGPVTAVDVEADACLRQRLLGECPAYGWLSEETADGPERLARERVWVVDPLDGTREYLRQVPQFAVSIALVERGEPVLAVVYNPALDELFAAERGAGCFRNGDRVALTDGPAELQGAAVLVSPGAVGRGDLRDLAARLGSVRPAGSIAYRLALVAAGQADLAVSLKPKNEWDVCAGDLLVREAGGEAVGLDRRRRRYNQERTLLCHGFVAGRPTLVAGFTGLLAALPADTVPDVRPGG